MLRRMLNGHFAPSAVELTRKAINLTRQLLFLLILGGGGA